MAAHAHSENTSYLRLDSSNAQGIVKATWDLNAADIDWTVDLDLDTNGVVTWGEVQERRAAIDSLALKSLKIERGTTLCPLSIDDLALTRHTDATFISLALKAQCPPAGAIAVSSSLFFAADASQRVLVELTNGRQSFSAVLSPLSPRWVQPKEPPVWETFVRYLSEGIWHVTVGFDHILFTLLLFLPIVLRNGIRDLLKVIAIFTVAHTLTLALSATRIIALPGIVIEIAIALSIVAAAVMVFYPRTQRWRAHLAFVFGLAHGFAFAQAISSIEPSGLQLFTLLIGFNLGVALAQLLLIALAWAPLRTFLLQSPHGVHPL